MRLGIAEVDGDLNKKRLIIKGNVHIVNIIKRIQKIEIGAELIYYKERGWEDHDQRTESCDKKENDGFCCSARDGVEKNGAKYREKRNMFKDHDQKKESRGWKEKERSCADHEAEDIGGDHYKIRNTFKDHKPEAYVPPPRQEYFWGDIQSGMHKKFPPIPGAGSQFTAGFPNYNGFYYPAPWPQQEYM